MTEPFGGGQADDASSDLTRVFAKLIFLQHAILFMAATGSVLFRGKAYSATREKTIYIDLPQTQASVIMGRLFLRYK